MWPESIATCCPPSYSEKIVTSPVEPVAFFLWDRIKYNKNWFIQFDIVTNIHMDNKGFIFINYKNQSILSKCTEEEIEKYFDK